MHHVDVRIRSRNGPRGSNDSNGNSVSVFSSVALVGYQYEDWYIWYCFLLFPLRALSA